MFRPDIMNLLEEPSLWLRTDKDGIRRFSGPFHSTKTGAKFYLLISDSSASKHRNDRNKRDGGEHPRTRRKFNKMNSLPAIFGPFPTASTVRLFANGNASNQTGKLTTCEELGDLLGKFNS